MTPAGTAALRRYSLAWKCLRPLLPMVVAYRAARGKEDPARRAERFGHYGHRDNLPQNPIWLHAVSVGECMAALVLADAMRAAGEAGPILITTNTTTAAERVAAHAARQPADADWLFHLYQPLDHPGLVAAFLDQLSPQLAVFLESDFWPNLISQTAAREIPVIFASTQLSQRAFLRWQARPALAKAVFGAADHVLAVDEAQAAHIRQLGAAPDVVSVGGSLKLPRQSSQPDPDFTAAIKAAAGDRHILIAASTHDGEEDFVFSAVKQLGNDWFTVIAPRHPHRGEAVAKLADSHGFATGRRSLGMSPAPQDRLYITDTLGEMDSLFSVADIVFLGGSLVPLGGHNPVEPAAHGTPLLTGPHVFKNRPEFDALQKTGVAYEITDADGLAKKAGQIVANPQQRVKIAAAARKFAAEAGKRAQLAAHSCLALLQD